MDLVLWWTVFKNGLWSENPNIPEVPPETSHASTAPSISCCLHILIAFHLDSDECVNAISRVRKDEKDPAIVLKCVSLGNRQKECVFAYIMLSQLAENHITPSFESQWIIRKKNGCLAGHHLFYSTTNIFCRTRLCINMQYVCTVHTEECDCVLAVTLSL